MVDYSASVSNKLCGTSLMTLDDWGWFRAGDSACDCKEWSPYAGWSDVDIEGPSSSINDGDSV